MITLPAIYLGNEANHSILLPTPSPRKEFQVLREKGLENLIEVFYTKVWMYFNHMREDLYLIR